MDRNRQIGFTVLSKLVAFISVFFSKAVSFAISASYERQEIIYHDVKSESNLASGDIVNLLVCFLKFLFCVGFQQIVPLKVS